MDNTALLLTTAISLADARPLDFTLQYPPRREYFQTHFHGNLDLDSLQILPEVILYLHIPFCETRCSYCNFAVDICQDTEIQQNYVRALCTQIQRLNDFLPPPTIIPAIDIGGGTPTILDAKQLETILTAVSSIQQRFSTALPMSIETTPRIAALHPERLAVLCAGGIDRISMGVQSINSKTLSGINRNLQDNFIGQAMENLRKAGFHRINADIIFGLPGQGIADWEETTRNIVRMDFDSITTYDCLYRGKGRLIHHASAPPSPEDYGRLYDTSYLILGEAGFHTAYGSVNFSRHTGETGTSVYYERRLFQHTPYLGLGNYASSQVGNQWWFTPYSVRDWVQCITSDITIPQGDVYILPKTELMAKQILLSLNFGEIHKEWFAKRFNVQFCDIYADAVDYALNHELLRNTANGYGIVPGHFGDMHRIRSLFYTPSAIKWLENQYNHQE